MMLFDPRSEHKRGNNVAGRKITLSPDKEAGRQGWHSREIKPEESEHKEGHIHWGGEKVT
jgi:hypothetical protein